MIIYPFLYFSKYLVSITFYVYLFKIMTFKMYLIHVLSFIKLNSQIILLVLFSYDCLPHFIFFLLGCLFFLLILLAGNHFVHFFHYFTLIVMYFFFCSREDVVTSLLMLDACGRCFKGFLFSLYLQYFRLCLDLGTGL